METNLELIRRIIIAIDDLNISTNVLIIDKFGIDAYSFVEIFFHTEVLYKAGYLTYFQYFETPDYRSNFIIGPFTSQGVELTSSAKILVDWDKVKENIKTNVPYILIQNLRFYFQAFIDGPLWRYMGIDKLESMLSTSSLYFCRADLLGDRFEGSNPIPTIQNRPKFYEGASQHYLEQGLPDLQKALRRCTYINCWHSNLNESALMWKTYGKINKTLAVQTTIQIFERSIREASREFAFGPVHYIDYDKDYISEANGLIPYFYKQKEYEGEREFRFITDNLELANEIVHKKASPPRGLFIEINVQLLIQRITISPFSSPKFKKQVVELLEKYCLVDKLTKSSVRTTPNF